MSETPSDPVMPAETIGVTPLPDVSPLPGVKPRPASEILARVQRSAIELPPPVPPGTPARSPLKAQRRGVIGAGTAADPFQQVKTPSERTAINTPTETAQADTPYERG